MAPQTIERPYRGGIRYPLQGRSLAVFKMTPPLHERRRSVTMAKEREPIQREPELAMPKS